MDIKNLLLSILTYKNILNKLETTASSTYIRAPEKNGQGERIEHQDALNFLSEKPLTQKLEMLSLARETNRSKVPVNHWIFAWPEGEQPTHEQVDELVKFFIEEMGLADHQAIYALHCDTKNYHVHIAINRVHPLTNKVVRVNHGFDIRQAQKFRALIEKKQGWSVLENAPYVVTEEGEIARRNAPPESKPDQRHRILKHPREKNRPKGLPRKRAITS